MRILLVDDDIIIRKIVKNMVDVIGADMLEAENGLLGLEELYNSSDPVDVIILDWIMPEMNGLEFLKAVKAEEKYKDIPVIMLTGVSDKDKMIEAIRAGAKQYITKPFNSEELLTKLVQCLGLDLL